MDPSWQGKNEKDNSPQTLDNSQKIPQSNQPTAKSIPQPLAATPEIPIPIRPSAAPAASTISPVSLPEPEKKPESLASVPQPAQPASQESKPVLEQEKPSKLKLILLIVLAILVVAAAVYWFFFYQAKVFISTNPNSAKIEIAGLTAVGSLQTQLQPGNYTLKITLSNYVPYEKNLTLKASQKFNFSLVLNHLPEPVKVIDYPAWFVNPSEDGESLLYLSKEGKTLYRIDNVASDSKQKPYAITPDVFQDVKEIVWQPTRELALIKQAERWYLYDFKRYDLLNQESQQWSEGIGKLAWSPDGAKVVYYYNPPEGEKTLIRANKDNSEMERFYNFKDTNITNPQIHWSSDGKKILVVDKSIFILDVYTKTLQQLKQFETVTAAQFTPDNQHIIYEKDGYLYLINLEGEERQDLAITTSLDKTVWLDASNLLYFAEAAGSDQLYQYNWQSQEKIPYSYDSSYTIHARKMNISKDKSKVFYSQDTDLYSLKLVEKEYP